MIYDVIAVGGGPAGMGAAFTKGIISWEGRERQGRALRSVRGTASERVPCGDLREAQSEREVGLEASTGHGSGLCADRKAG